MAKGKGKNKNSAKTLDYSKQRLTDADIASLKLSQESTAYEEVDFSQNKLSSASLHAIVTLCSRCSNFRVLKVYKNDIDDSGADELAWLFEQCQTLEEVHLSHNRLTARGAKTLASAADWWRKETGSPLWLRMEQNLVASPTQLLRSFENTLSICGREDERRCTTRLCCWKKKVHMPFFYMQKDTWKEDEANVQEDAIAWQDDEWWVDSWQEPRPQRRQIWLPGDDPDSWAAEAVDENWDNAPSSSSREPRYQPTARLLGMAFVRELFPGCQIRCSSKSLPSWFARPAAPPGIKNKICLANQLIIVQSVRTIHYGVASLVMNPDRCGLHASWDRFSYFPS